MLITDLSLFNSQKLETAQTPINMDKLWWIYTMKHKTIDIYNYMDEYQILCLVKEAKQRKTVYTEFT